MRLTKEDHDKIWAAGNTGGWQGVYEAGVKAGLELALDSIPSFVDEDYSRNMVREGIRRYARSKRGEDLLPPSPAGDPIPYKRGRCP